MFLKFIILALVIEASMGEEIVPKNQERSQNASTAKSVAQESIIARDGSPVHDRNLVSEGKELIQNSTKIVPSGTESAAKISAEATTVKGLFTNVEKLDPAGKLKGVGLDATVSSTMDSTTTKNTTVTTTTPSQSTTTTTAPATTTAAPSSNPETGSWKVGNETVCIAVNMEIVFNLTYPVDNTVLNKTVIVPKNATASGNCSNTFQSITLNWGEGNSFEMEFGINKTSEKFEIKLLNLTVNTTGFPNAKGGIIVYKRSKPEFPSTPLNMSYKCDKKQVQVLNSTVDNAVHAMLYISHAQFQAFMSKQNNGIYGEAKDCDGFDTPDAVPITVGCVLIILIVIVLVAYMIGRRRSQNRGYLSM